jgi:xylan 1,4-beta-xylosidase
MTSENVFFNAHHAPIGAFASFTLGYPGACGGLGRELARPADQNVYVGLETGTRNVFQALPFYAGSGDERARYDTDRQAREERTGVTLLPFPEGSIRREFGLGTDTWTAGDLTFRIYSQARPVPDPDLAAAEEMQEVLLPGVCAELTVDNTRGTLRRRAFFGFQGTDPYTAMRRFDPERCPDLVGVGQGRHSAIVAAAQPGVHALLAFTPEEFLANSENEEYRFDLGNQGALILPVPAGEKRTFRFVVAFFHDGFVTGGLDAKYYYTRYFKDIEDAAGYGLRTFERYRAGAQEADRRLERPHLSAEQRRMMALAMRSYYGSTELLEEGGRPFWIVNEGEYRMLNTLDLTVDHLFFEMRQNPWTVRNVLDRYALRHSYEDRVRSPGDPTEHPGGVSFAHDMGVANSVAPAGFSVYERMGTNGVFSFMTHEQLLNWICCAAVYYFRTRDERWLGGCLGTLRRCLASLQQRDHPDPDRRNGVMGQDTARTHGAAEITTYDCHDPSLRQARNNLYLAVKTWAAYVMLERIFSEHELPREARDAAEQAGRCARTIVRHRRPEGYLPAILPEQGETANEARILPAIEGLIFPYWTGCHEALDPEGRYGELVRTLRLHFETVLTPGVCLFPDGGWRLTSSHPNSWPSKIYLCQFIARRVLGRPWDEDGQRADRAHLSWLTNPRSAYWCWSDQIVEGVAVGAKYYPRGVTCALWLEEGEAAPGRG